MPLRFENWSDFAPLEPTMRALYHQKGLPFPEQGPFLVKVFVDHPDELSLLDKFIQEHQDHHLVLDEGRPGRREQSPSWERTHIDLYGPALSIVDEDKLIIPEKIRELTENKDINPRRRI